MNFEPIRSDRTRPTPVTDHAFPLRIALAAVLAALLLVGTVVVVGELVAVVAAIPLDVAVILGAWAIGVAGVVVAPFAVVRVVATLFVALGR
ncbi:hypothetical protein [Halomicrococcus gelatinilyticus]|uniref:hypothetical protein n=1 Tax=Halomicrococcus gelatinilyticus TaxID=1702103 RepID=UPI002E143289